MKLWSAVKWAYFIMVTLIALHAVAQRDEQTFILVVPGAAVAYVLWRKYEGAKV